MKDGLYPFQRGLRHGVLRRVPGKCRYVAAEHGAGAFGRTCEDADRDLVGKIGFRQGLADEAGCAGDEDRHVGLQKARARGIRQEFRTD